jgi:hypothetical protein
VTTNAIKFTVYADKRKDGGLFSVETFTSEYGEHAAIYYAKTLSAQYGGCPVEVRKSIMTTIWSNKENRL